MSELVINMGEETADNETIGQLIEEFKPFLSENDRSFIERVFKNGIDVYRNRIKQYGLVGLKHILDAGCGYGQWSIALARENEAVTAIDVRPERLIFLKALADKLNLCRISTKYARTWSTGLEGTSFEAIFCYGVLFLTPWRETLSEFSRLLQPGGRLYVNANGFGWYRHLWHTGYNATPDYDPKKLAAAVLLNTLNYERGLPLKDNGQILIEPEAIKAQLSLCGFEDIQQGAEGTIIVNSNTPPTQPFFQGVYRGETGVYEIIATKRNP